MTIGLGLTVLSVGIWLWLLCFRGQFWRCDQQLELAETSQQPEFYPAVCAVVPARNEADVLPMSLRSLLTQVYPGEFRVILVDDHSSDGTAAVAQATAAAVGQCDRLQVMLADTLPPGWSGKLWAMDQGVQQAQTVAPDYFLLTDADIQHDPANLQRLVNRAIAQDLDLASIMVRLRCDSVWEKLLIPAFVFFFQKLYPFRWVNSPQNPTAAAAGGCILVKGAALDRMGGIAAIRQALIDDCTLAQAIKVPLPPRPACQKERGLKTDSAASLRYQPSVPGTELSTGNTLHLKSTSSGKIWLGLSDRTQSLRPYPSLASIWHMVARTAYTQLNYSPLLLVGTLLGMGMVYLVAPIALLVGLLTRNPLLALTGLFGWLLMTIAYFPTVRFYRGSPFYAVCLPAIALLYTLMTIDSAFRHWQGRGGAWKGRVYPG